jgi:transposase
MITTIPGGPPVTRAVSKDVIRLSRRRRRKLQRITRAQTAPAREMRRARIVLLAAARVPNEQIARQLGCHADTVRATRRRYLAEGMKAMKDRPRPGRPLVYDVDARLLIIATATSQPPGPETGWSHARIAAHLAARHQIRISASQAGRILADADIKPHLVRGWLNRTDDPAFFGKARAICELYRNPPPGAVLLSIDEKTGIQARSRKHPARRARPGRRERREFEYIRHGTVSLIAAMNVTTGQVLGEIITRNNSSTFCAFLALIDQAIPRHLAIHLVMDNGSSHTSRATRAWLAAHPRFHVTRTPVHASWLNMVEIWFSILQRRLLRRGEFTSRAHLADQILEFICNYDDKARPFRWTYDGRPLKAA